MGAIASEVPSSSPACGWPLSQDSCPGSGHSVHVGGGRKNGKEARGAAGLPKTPTRSPHLWASASPVPPRKGGPQPRAGARGPPQQRGDTGEGAGGLRSLTEPQSRTLHGNLAERSHAVGVPVRKKYNLDFVLTNLTFSKIGKTPRPYD